MVHRILWVNDIPNRVNRYVQMLQTDGYEVLDIETSVVSGLQALANSHAKRMPIDVVIVDIMLPFRGIFDILSASDRDQDIQYGGIDLYMKIRWKYPDTKIVIDTCAKGDGCLGAYQDVLLRSFSATLHNRSNLLTGQDAEALLRSCRRLLSCARRPVDYASDLALDDPLDALLRLADAIVTFAEKNQLSGDYASLYYYVTGKLDFNDFAKDAKYDGYAERTRLTEDILHNASYSDLKLMLEKVVDKET